MSSNQAHSRRFLAARLSTVKGALLHRWTGSLRHLSWLHQNLAASTPLTYATPYTTTIALPPPAPPRKYYSGFQGSPAADAALSAIMSLDQIGGPGCVP